MATDDRRMHEGRSRSLDEREPRDRGNEEPRGEGDAIGTSAELSPYDKLAANFLAMAQLFIK